MTAVTYARPCPTPARGRPDVSASIRVAEPVVVRSLQPGCWAPPRLPAHVYRRRRALAAAVVACSLLTGWSGLSALGVELFPGAQPPGSPGSPGGQVHVVQPGDTLWSIARNVQPDGDVRPLVDRLMAVNGGAALEVGERIVVPIQ